MLSPHQTYEEHKQLSRTARMQLFNLHGGHLTETMIIMVGTTTIIAVGRTIIIIGMAIITIGTTIITTGTTIGITTGITGT